MDRRDASVPQLKRVSTAEAQRKKTQRRRRRILETHPNVLRNQFPQKKTSCSSRRGSHLLKISLIKMKGGRNEGKNGKVKEKRKGKREKKEGEGRGEESRGNGREEKKGKES